MFINGFTSFNRFLGGEDSIGAPFTPPNIPSLAAWYRADSVVRQLPAPIDPTSVSGRAAHWKSDVGVTHAGGKVSAWADQSGNSIDLLNAGADGYKPDYIASSANLNGLPSVSFNIAAAEWLQSNNAMSLTQPYTIYYVVYHKPTNLHTSQLFGDATNAEVLYFNASTTLAIPSSYAGVVLGSTGYGPGPVAMVMCSVFNGATSKLYVNSGLHPQSGDAGAAAINHVVNLSAGPSGVQAYNGEVGEIIIYSGAHTQATVGGIMQSLANKFSVALQIPEWDDQSGTNDTNKNALQADPGLQPTLIAADPNFNGQPSIQSKRSGDVLITGNWAVKLGPTNTFAACVRLSHTSGNPEVFDSNDGTNRLIMYCTSGTNQMAIQASAGAVISDSILVANNTYIVCGVFDGTTPQGTVNTATLANIGTTGATLIPNGLALLNFEGGTVPGVQLAELCVYNKRLSQAEWAQLSGYMSARYSVPITPPKNIEGLQGWYRSDLGITLNGSNVSGWADQSGKGHDLLQVTSAQQPGYVTGALPYIANNTHSQLFASAFTSPAQPFEVLIVVEPTTSSPVSNGYILDWNAGNTQAIAQSSGGGALLYSGVLLGNSSATSNATPSIIDAVVNGATSTLIVNDNPVTGDIGIVTPPGAGLCVGDYWAAEGFGFIGKIYEVIIYDHTLATSERAQVVAYLKARYGL